MLAELSIAIFVLTRAAASDGENAKEFRDMCALYRLLKEKLTEPKLPTGSGASQTYETPQTLMTAILQRAVKLNLTVAANDIAQALSSDKSGLDGNKLTSDPETKNIFSGITPEIAAVMLQQYRTTARGKQPDKTFVDKFNLPVAENQRSQLQPVIANLADDVLTTANELTDTTTRITKLRKDARTAMIKALYGNAYGTKLEAQITGDSDVPPPGPADFPWAVSKTRDNNCKEASETPGDAGTSIATDITCLCLNGHTTGHTACFSPALTGSTDFASAHGPTAVAPYWQQLASKCDAHTLKEPQKPTAHTLSLALSKVINAMGTNWGTQAAPEDTTGNAGDRAAILGFYVLDAATKVACVTKGSGSYSAGGKGACISYAALRKDDKVIPWELQVRAAMEKLADINQELLHNATLLKRAETIEKQMETVLLMRNLLNPTAPALPPEVSQTTVEQQNKCAKFNNNETYRPTDSCEDDKTKKECKPKPGTENTAAGAGETTKEGAAATTGCARHKNQPDCDADKTGVKQNCAFKKGKEDEDDKDTEKRHNSSFLVNKRFALMACTFVGLLLEVLRL
ncbi:Trypanosomal VSG domain/Trypanosome variant surface glycoprotein C-terminal domain containing protein, putative [Trypanosoma equiperdum]|uniref:Trypanosomal VSG domain/Trypanosome variant surface glycoprotein C-terminal domain containing protein, putative n=1 Tax=Trypanosoma equiperdum TaxID=5694 RepID=A0A1G4IGN2_TRYEQ|nr:Trypanosomal VSG domain/Trypanosome variant surface glycoprotein C-terminal domain containing protein, putative [Trypanosoma equiperdum]